MGLLDGRQAQKLLHPAREEGFKMIAFVILHYRAADMTRRCVKKIQALPGEKQIVIVDNASPNGSGQVLLDEYASCPEIKVILNPENSGFAKGNNLGVKWVREHKKPEFTVVLNNDVEILQEDFCKKIGEIYEKQPFDVLGPDIVSVFSGIHQNPKSMHGCTLDSVRKKRASVERTKNPILLLLSSGEKNSPAIWKQVQRRKRARQHIDTTAPAEGIVLHGSCVIFSERYLEIHPEPFYPKTYMYYEMEILDWICRKEKSVVLYDPSISVLHYQYVSSKQEYRSIIKRSRFVIDCLMDSLTAAEELILENDGEA